MSEEVRDLVPLSGVAPPAEVMSRAEGAARAVRSLILRTAITLQGKRYIPAEGWQSIAATLGLSPVVETVEELPSGDIRAVAVLVRNSDGKALSRAEGYVGTDEVVWFGGTTVDRYGNQRTHPRRPRFAIRAMAQTRAVSRACRSALSWVVPLVDESLEVTPAEEMAAEPITVKVEPVKAEPVKVQESSWERFRKSYARATERGILPDGWSAGVLHRYGVKSSRDIPATGQAELAAELERMLALDTTAAAAQGDAFEDSE